MRKSFAVGLVAVVAMVAAGYAIHARSGSTSKQVRHIAPLVAAPLPAVGVPDAGTFVLARELDAWYGAQVDGALFREAVAVELARQAWEAEQARLAEQRRVTSGVRNMAPEVGWPSSLYPCGGDLPPCYVKQRESGGNYNARNPSSTASGAWQFLDSTWAGFGGYPSAYLAPPDVQDERARQLWAGGAGCSHWSAC